ncbi:MAG: N(5)-(carboxyethyl)ornithine synthase [Syntrophomonadaceae bacterium]|nr:N(5)-(carboxyethyl)ornithine synthase [Syntrophomonadaceae bacterium]
MNGIGFPVSTKENERRRALIPPDLANLKRETLSRLFFEKGYGATLGFNDNDYVSYGAQVVSTETVLAQKVICDAKIGDADYLSSLKNQIVFGWLHAVLNREVTDSLIAGKLTAYAWEEMFHGGRHLFWHNNEIAGEAAILHAYQHYGSLPRQTKVEVLGRGNIGRGAINVLCQLGADVVVYDRKMERLFQSELHLYDIVVNAILWDKNRKDHIVCRSDLSRFKPGAMIIDISCDRNGGIETSYPTSISDPVYMVDNVIHYAVDHTPALFYKTASSGISRVVAGFLDDLVAGQECEVLERACIVKDGMILSDEIKMHQNRK